MKTIIAKGLSISFLFISISIFAQSKDSIQSVAPIHSLGLGAGFTTGYGLSYKYMPKKYGVQINFAPYSSENFSMYSVGITFLHKLKQTKKTQLYLYQGNHCFTTIDKTTSTLPGGLEKKEISQKSYWMNGLGFGFEILLVENIGFNLMTGIAKYDTFQTINLTGETALYYKF